MGNPETGIRGQTNILFLTWGFGTLPPPSEPPPALPALDNVYFKCQRMLVVTKIEGGKTSKMAE